MAAIGGQFSPWEVGGLGRVVGAVARVIAATEALRQTTVSFDPYLTNKTWLSWASVLCEVIGPDGLMSCWSVVTVGSPGSGLATLAENYSGNSITSVSPSHGYVSGMVSFGGLPGGSARVPGPTASRR